MEEKDLTHKELKYFREILKNNSSQGGECIEWTGKTALGYGYFMAYKTRWSAHRASYLVTNEKIPKGLYICHKCNNRKCININHLYAGTPKQNSQDLMNTSYYQSVKIKAVKKKKQNKQIREAKFREELNKFLTVQEVSEILHVHPNTVLNCLHSGHIQGIRTGRGKRSSYRIHQSEFHRMGLFNLEDIIEETIKKRLQQSSKLL